MTVLTYANAFPGIPFPQHFWTGPVTNLTHRWQMDTGSISGGVVTDLVGSLNATINGSPSTVTSPSGAFASTALGFSGSAQYLSLTSSPITLTSAYTVAFWVNLPDITFQPDGGGGLDPRIYSFFDGTHESVTANQSGAGLPGSLEFDAANSASTATAVAPLVNNTWTHIAVTFDGSTTQQFYVNGSLVSGGGASGGAESVATGFTIAARGDGVRELKGSIYQFVTYSAVLTSGQVTTLFNAG